MNSHDILARPGANPQVLAKKVLLAKLARAEAERFGINPTATEVATFRDTFLAEIGIVDEAALARWLAEASLSRAEFDAVMMDYAAILAVDAWYATRLAPRVELHRRLVDARMRRLAADAPGD